MRILLIEDDPVTSRSIALMLGHANFNVYTTDLGEEGIDLAKLYDYNLILLDLVLPDINGHDVLRQLRVARIDTPISSLSGETDTENKMRGNAMHLTGKEYQMLELLSLRKGTTLTKEMFLNQVYGGMDEPKLKIIDVFICKLRKKLSEATGRENHIETVWGRGYVLRDPKPDTSAQDMAISA